MRLRIILEEADIEVPRILVEGDLLFTGVVYCCCLNDECGDVVIRCQGIWCAAFLRLVFCRASLVVRGLEDETVQLDTQESRREDPKNVGGAPAGARPILRLAAVVKPGRLAKPILLL